MRFPRVRVRLTIVVVGLVSAAPAGAAVVNVQVPAPATPAARAVPPAVIAYPLSPSRALVTAVAPRGRARLTLAPGAWIIATSYSPRTGPRRVRARLVQVPRRGPVPAVRELQAPGAGEGGVAIGRISSTGFDDGELAPISSALDAALIAEAARLAGKAPCKPPIVPPAAGDRSAIWQAIERAARQAGRGGPRAVRGQARAAAARLAGSQPSATFGGSIRDIGGGTLRGTFTVTTSAGAVIWGTTIDGTTIRGVLQQAFQQGLLSKCAPSRIQVDATVSFDASEREARSRLTIALKAVGRERTGSDGRVERGAFEYEAPVSWTLAGDWSVEKLPTSPQPNCPLAPLAPVNFENTLGPPTSMGISLDGGRTFSLRFTAAAGGAYALSGSCNSRSAVTHVASFEAPIGRVGDTVRVSGQQLGGIQGTFTADVTVTSLPSLPEVQ